MYIQRSLRTLATNMLRQIKIIVVELKKEYGRDR